MLQLKNTTLQEVESMPCLTDAGIFHPEFVDRLDDEELDCWPYVPLCL